MKTTTLSPLFGALLLALCHGNAVAAQAEHKELEATLHAPFKASDARRTFNLSFHYPGLERSGTVEWTLELVDPRDRVARRWRGKRVIQGEAVTVPVAWDGKVGGVAAPAGLYRVRLRAGLLGDHEDPVVQDWQIAVGALPAQRTPRFSPLPGVRELAAGMAPAAGALPYTVYLGNLHSQSNHSDGGGALDDCKGSQDPL